MRQELQRHGNHVTEIAVYQSLDVAKPDPAIVDALARQEIDWIVVSSSAIATSLVRLFDHSDLKRTKILSIGPIVTQTLTELGMIPTAETAESNVESIVAFLNRAFL